jgi:hypothetical protein
VLDTTVEKLQGKVQVLVDVNAAAGGDKVLCVGARMRRKKYIFSPRRESMLPFLFDVLRCRNQ